MYFNWRMSGTPRGKQNCFFVVLFFICVKRLKHVVESPKVQAKTLYSCALLLVTAVSTSGFDHPGVGGAGSDRACRAMETESQGNHYPV